MAEKMACKADDSLGEDLPPPNLPKALSCSDHEQVEYDFVEQPSQDFFCPVTLELLINPHLAVCCGNHLSQEAANRLQRDGKPCPICKEPQLNTVPNKHYKRMVNDIKVHCPHKKSGCGWVGGVNEVKQHSDSCPKRPWQCQYCEFIAIYEIGIAKHVSKCTKYPVACPNSCEIVSVPRCDLEAHLMVCPLQPVVCEYAEVGCDVKVPRRDLARHMKESQQQHLLSTTLLNLRMTRENTEEKNRLLQTIKEKDKLLKEKDIEEKKQLKLKNETIADLQKKLGAVQEQAHENEIKAMKQLQMKEEFKKELAVKDQRIKERDKKITDLQQQLKQLQEGLEAKVTTLQQQVVKYGEDTQEHLKQHDKHIECLMSRQLQGFTLHEFILTGFKKCQSKGQYGDWYSDPFYSHPEGYKFQLNIATKGHDNKGDHISVYFKLLQGIYDDDLDWPITTTAHVQLLNQLGDHNHHEMTGESTWDVDRRDCEEEQYIATFIKKTKLEFNADENTQYLRKDCLKFRVYFKTTPEE